jgi:predicted MPP superfamily phosphohydrolase
VPALRRAIEASGCVDLGVASRRLLVRGEEILLAGNERPWFGPPCLAEKRPADFSILLSHSPDQIAWARRHQFDLMLSGHTHGGQIRFPIIGPVVCPSWYGVRYSAGLFLEDPIVAHVSRGISGLFPIRWNCQPEVTLLVLERAA